MLLRNVQIHDNNESVQNFYQRYNAAASPFGNGQG